MARNLERYDKLVIAILGIAILVLAIGYWFAQEKSEPVYLSKIDRLMFDKDNKSPAYVLTLPDKVEVSSKKSGNDVSEDNVEEEHIANSEEEKEFSLEDLINNVPSIAKLESKNFPIQMKNIAALPDMIEVTEDGLTLPKFGHEGHKPWIEYGNMVSVLPNFKKVAIVVGNLGFDSEAISKIAASFQPELSMSFHPYMTNEQANISVARQKGHETYMDVLLASSDFTHEDTGPAALNFNLDKDEVFSRFYKVISKSEPIGGVVIRDGLIEEDNNGIIIDLLEEIRDRGLLMVDATSSDIINSIKVDGLARRKADLFISKDMSSDEIDEQLKKAENIAFDKGQVLIVTDEKPLIVMRINKWIETFSPQLSYEEAKTKGITKPFALVPVSNLVVE